MRTTESEYSNTPGAPYLDFEMWASSKARPLSFPRTHAARVPNHRSPFSSAVTSQASRSTTFRRASLFCISYTWQESCRQITTICSHAPCISPQFAPQKNSQNSRPLQNRPQNYCAVLPVHLFFRVFRPKNACQAPKPSNPLPRNNIQVAF
jgi:hypothetical protein